MGTDLWTKKPITMECSVAQAVIRRHLTADARIKAIEQWYSLEINKEPKMEPIIFFGAAYLFSTYGTYNEL
jgi:hypothetical protein